MVFARPNICGNVISMEVRGEGFEGIYPEREMELKVTLEWGEADVRFWGQPSERKIRSMMANLQAGILDVLYPRKGSRSRLDEITQKRFEREKKAMAKEWNTEADPSFDYEDDLNEEAKIKLKKKKPKKKKSQKKKPKLISHRDIEYRIEPEKEKW